MFSSTSFSFVVDLPTLCAVSVFMTATAGLLLLLSWLQNRGEWALALWGAGYLVGSVGMILLALGQSIPAMWSVGAANAVICTAYGLMWAGARSFEGRRVLPWHIVVGPAVWLSLYQLPPFGSLPDAIMATSAILATYTMLGAREVWHARDRELISRWPTLALLIVHAGFLLVRISAASTLTFPRLVTQTHHVAVLVIAFESVFVAYCLAFLRVSMAKERAELAQRKAALTDSLTGLANRRAFFEIGVPLLQRTVADRRSAALLLFDLDRFKSVNDTAGHQTGDCVLKSFSALIADAMRPGDLHARLGGEEFACLLPDTPIATALQIAERIRRNFAAMHFQGLPVHTTVSAGVAMAGDTETDLYSLLASADRALYRAKAEGRNRVAPAPLVLIDRTGSEAAAEPVEVVPAPAIAPPVTSREPVSQTM